jgi:hypothetical protein
VQSIDPQVWPLLQQYEADGLAVIRGSLWLPDRVPGMAFNPNHEVRWTNQYGMGIGMGKNNWKK